MTAPRTLSAQRTPEAELAVALLTIDTTDRAGVREAMRYMQAWLGRRGVRADVREVAGPPSSQPRPARRTGRRSRSMVMSTS